jgi:hypothetical protein
MSGKYPGIQYIVLFLYVLKGLMSYCLHLVINENPYHWKRDGINGRIIVNICGNHLLGDIDRTMRKVSKKKRILHKIIVDGAIPLNIHHSVKQALRIHCADVEFRHHYGGCQVS